MEANAACVRAVRLPQRVWIEQVWADKLSALRGPGESYSDVILRLVALERG